MTKDELINIMHDHGVTIKELADELGVSINTVYSWRDRSGHGIGRWYAVKIRKLFGLDQNEYNERDEREYE